MTKEYRQTRKIFLFAGLIGALGLGLPAVAQTYLTPTSASPTANTIPVAQPLNSSSSLQHKVGTLLIGPNGGTAKLCLNADLESDTTRCVDSWDDVANAIGGPFLHYDSTGPATPLTSVTGKDPNFYTSQPGFVRVQAACVSGSCVDGNRQFYSYLTAAPAGLNGAYGLYATDGGSSSNYAGYFSGRLHIYQTIPGGALGQICLNGLTPNTECIDQWTDVSSGGGSYLQLQTTNPPTPNTGSISISGTGVVGSIVIDSPNATMNRTATCGDGMCTAINGEDSSTCPIDCAAITSPVMVNLSVPNGGGYCSLDTNTACINASGCTGKGVCQTYTGRVNVSTPSNQLPAGSQVNMLIIRSTSATPSFVPLQGSTYTTGSVFGDTTILFAGKMNQGQVNTFVGRDRVTASGTYYYRAYLGNLYPRYGTIYTPVTNATVTYKQLLVAKNLNGGSPVSENPDNQISCGTGSGSLCLGYYPVGTVVGLTADAVLAGYNFKGWIGCNEPRDEANPICTVNMDADMLIQATYTSGSGGPGGGPPLDTT